MFAFVCVTQGPTTFEIIVVLTAMILQHKVQEGSVSVTGCALVHRLQTNSAQPT